MCEIFDLVTATAPIWSSQPADQTVFDGTDVTITCRAAGSPQPKTSWTKDGEGENKIKKLQLDNGGVDMICTRTEELFCSFHHNKILNYQTNVT